MGSSVKFMQSIEFKTARSVDTFIEIGPCFGGLARQINSDVNIYQVEVVLAV